MVEKFGNKLSDWAENWIPDPFVLAIILTLFVGCFGFIFQLSSGAFESQSAGQLFTDLISAWWAGIYGNKNLMTFGMQMSLVLIVGYCIAHTGPVRSRWHLDYSRNVFSLSNLS